jgi:hypothetical protein
VTSRKPLLWRAFDAIETTVAPRIEEAARSGHFLDAVGLAARAQAGIRRGLEARSRRLWHLINLPAGTDVMHLRRQVAQLDRELHRVSSALDRVVGALEQPPREDVDARIPPTSPAGVLRAPAELLDRVRRDVECNALRARNGVKLAAGIGRPKLGLTPKELVWSSGHAQLWRYRSDHVSRRPPLLIVYSLVSKSYVLDLQPGNSFVERLPSAGFDVFMLDWVPADERHAHERLEDYADHYLPEAVRRTREEAANSTPSTCSDTAWEAFLRCFTPPTTPMRRCAP